jgi:hypothetical protein
MVSPAITKNKNTLLWFEEGAAMQPVKFESASSQNEPSPTCMVRVMMVHLDCSRNVVHDGKSLAHLGSF